MPNTKILEIPQKEGNVYEKIKFLYCLAVMLLKKFKNSLNILMENMKVEGNDIYIQDTPYVFIDKIVNKRKEETENNENSNINNNTEQENIPPENSNGMTKEEDDVPKQEIKKEESREDLKKENILQNENENNKEKNGELQKKLSNEIVLPKNPSDQIVKEKVIDTLPNEEKNEEIKVKVDEKIVINKEEVKSQEKIDNNLKNV